MANFSEAQKYVIENEGWYVNNPSDVGKETYGGISRRYNPTCPIWPIIDQKPHPIKWNIHFPELDGMVDQWYKTNEWDTIQGDQIADTGTAIDFYDWHVNSGGAVKQVQQVIGVTADGQFGPHSLQVLNNQNWLDAIHQARLAYYKSLNQPQFEAEWLNRAITLYNKMKAL